MPDNVTLFVFLLNKPKTKMKISKSVNPDDIITAIALLSTDDKAMDCVFSYLLNINDG